MRGLKTTGAGWDDAYDPAEFAEKHGLTLGQAKIVLNSNGPSRHKCDMAAVVFRRVLDLKRQRPVPVKERRGGGADVC